MKRLSPLFSLILIPLLVTLPLSAQLPESSNAPGTSAAPEALQIRVLDANPVSISVNSQAAAGIAVEITDSDGAPVTEAAVVVRLPDAGPTGAFADGSHAAVAYTDHSGRAQIASLKWGDTPGVVAMRITAVKGTAHAGILLERVLTAPSVNCGHAGESACATAQNQQAAPVPVAKLAPAAPVSTQQASVPVHPLTPATTPLKPEPTVSITNTAAATSKSHSHKKWLVIAAIAAGAGAGLAFAGKGKSSTPASSTPSLTIGSPTVSVGHP